MCVWCCVLRRGDMWPEDSIGDECSYKESGAGWRRTGGKHLLVTMDVKGVAPTYTYEMFGKQSIYGRIGLSGVTQEDLLTFLLADLPRLGRWENLMSEFGFFGGVYCRRQNRVGSGCDSLPCFICTQVA